VVGRHADICFRISVVCEEDKCFEVPIVQHMHLKDYNGVDPHLLGYCPLGQGKVNIPAILDIMAGRKMNGLVMVELDNDPRDPSPTTPVELAKTSKVYLESLGITFRA
jgi:inosose dehydratase